MPRVAVAGRVAVAARASIPLTQNLVIDNRNIPGGNFAAIGASLAFTGGQADPFGGTQACLISETAVLSSHILFASGSLQPSGSAAPRWLCASVYMKAGTRQFGGIALDGGGSFQVLATFDLSTGFCTQLVATSVQYPAAMAIEDLGNGWRRYMFAGYAPIPPTSGFYPIEVYLTNGAIFAGYMGDPTLNATIYAPAFAYANQPGPRTDTTAGAIATQLRNRVS